MLIIGCDFHTRYQQIAMMDEATGELTERLDDPLFPLFSPAELHFLTAHFAGCRVTDCAGPFSQLNFNTRAAPCI
jgi:hypothetical protein